MTPCCAALMCHAPIVVPAVGGSRGRECERTTHAMDAVARQVAAHAPDVIVLISPHTPRFPEAVGLFGARGLRGSFARFDAPAARIATAAAESAVAHLQRAADAVGLATRVAELDELDHGAAVPLHFLLQHAPDVPVALLSLPYPEATDADRIGECIRRACEAAGERWAVVASGDMSHRLLPGAPAGHHPRAREFDLGFVAALEARDYHGAVQAPLALRELAAEDVVDSTRAALAAVRYESQGARVYAYEGPFGVGYCEALLYTQTLEPGAGGAPPVLLEVARDAIHARLHGRAYSPPELPSPFDAPRAVFVTLRAADGELRGCIGRTEPVLARLVDEVADCAVGAALRDTRMLPVTADELPSLRIEVSVLDEPEPIEDPSALDPRRYGVVVRDGAGRRGVLLPAIEGVESVEQQLEITRRKAGIAPGAPVRLERFTVQKLKER